MSSMERRCLQSATAAVMRLEWEAMRERLTRKKWEGSGYVATHMLRMTSVMS